MKNNSKLVKKFRRSMFLNPSSLPIFPDIFYKTFRVDKFNGRLRGLIQGVDFLIDQSKSGKIKFEQVAEFGVAAGEGLRLLMIVVYCMCKIRNYPLPKFYGFDTFEGMPEKDSIHDEGPWKAGDYKGDYDTVKKFLSENPFDLNIELYKGLFSDTISPLDDSFNPQLILIDCDYYSSTRDVFINLKERLSTGTIVYFDDIGNNYGNPNIGEDKFIADVNSGKFGENLYLNRLYRNAFIWSDSNKPITRKDDGIKEYTIPLNRRWHI